MKKIINHFSFINLALHLIMSGLYLCWSIFVPYGSYELSVLYFGSETLFTSFSIYLASINKIWISKQHSQIHALYIAIRGIIYVLDDSGIYNTGNFERLIFLFVFSLVIVVPFNLKCYFYGYYNNEQEK